MSSTESSIKARELNSNSLRNLAHDHEIFSTSTSDESPSPLSATVTNLASNVYKELERIIRNFGENSVKDLMPVMISILGQFNERMIVLNIVFLSFQNRWTALCTIETKLNYKMNR